MHNLKIGAIVQVRMDSKRFPGKSLHRVSGKPLLEYLLDRLFHCQFLNNIVVATSREKSDDPIEQYCNKKGVAVKRGSLADVAGRFIQVLEEYGFDAFVRVNGDSPLLDQRLIEKGIQVFLDGDFDLVTNINPRTFPKGQSVEILRADTFRNSYNLMRKPDELEHVTRYFYQHKDDFKILNFASGKDYADIQLSVDTPEDLDNFTKIITQMVRPHWEYKLEDILKIYSELAYSNIKH